MTITISPSDMAWLRYIARAGGNVLGELVVMMREGGEAS